MIANERPNEKLAEPVVSLCEDAAAAMRIVEILTHHDAVDPATSPSQAYRALAATGMLLQRSGQVLKHIAHSFASQVDLGFIEMDPGTTYDEDPSRASQDLRLVVADAALSLDLAQSAVERALTVLAPARLRHASCA